MITIGHIKNLIFRRGDKRDLNLFMTHQLKKKGFFSSDFEREELNINYYMTIGTSDIISTVVGRSLESRIISKRTETSNSVILDTEELDEVGRVIPGGDCVIVIEQDKDFGLITYLKVMGMKQKKFQITEYEYVD